MKIICVLVKCYLLAAVSKDISRSATRSLYFDALALRYAKGIGHLPLSPGQVSPSHAPSQTPSPGQLTPLVKVRG